MKHTGAVTLSVFYIVFFVLNGFTTFASKYYAEIGLTVSQIGVLTSLPTLFGMALMPLLGVLSDRAKRKKALVSCLLALTGAAYLLVDSLTDFSLPQPATRFLPLLALLSLSQALIQPVTPICSAISIEYMESIGKSFSQIRMMGTIGHQLGVLLVGAFFVYSLRYLYTWTAYSLFAAALLALAFPPVEGHQHGKAKVSPRVLLRDKRVRALLGLVMIGTTTSLFYNSFISAFLGEMQVDNRISSLIVFLAVIPEIPLFFFAEKIMRKFSIWKWQMIGFVLNGIRWIGLYAASRLGSWPLVVVAQLVAVSAMFCFEFFPALYLSRIVAPELSSSAQTLLTLCSFGLARAVGCLAGGWLAGSIGIRGVFLVWGVMLLAAAAILRRPVAKLAREDEGWTDHASH